MENKYWCPNCGELTRQEISGFCCISCGSDDIWSDCEDNFIKNII